MEFKDLATFVRVAEEGDFSAAARSLGLTPSGVSKTIARLEDGLGRRLLQRSSRAMRLTPEGENFLEAARRVLGAMEEAKAIGSAIPAGTLRIRCVPTFARYQLAPIIPAFRRLYPRLRIAFVLSNERTASLDDQADVAIASGDLPNSSLIARRIASSRWVICASPAYLAERGSPASPADLERHECLNFSMQTKWNSWSSVVGTPNAEGGIVANQGDMLLALARAGAGIVRLAEFHISEDLRSGRLVQLFPDEQDQTEEPIYVLYQERRNLSPRIRAFVDFVERAFADTPWRYESRPA
ncbi:LysR family transcriptional regulator [Methylobacterium sp. Leaf125]|uniref:LysR family transcriptional regulator n=1 Tax=Methylobacterium sp. Leaf125 TaxID=1736265 RepID=UPI0006FD5646|nr:LysR family transcriptional regulator [Methylobacterium sp. Leaf125]KQQ40982.1 LysR family transcriptional regulator [Methylobacterium sp. Leaf125]